MYTRHRPIAQYGADPLQPDLDGNTALYLFDHMPCRFRSVLNNSKALEWILMYVII